MNKRFAVLTLLFLLASPGLKAFADRLAHCQLQNKGNDTFWSAFGSWSELILFESFEEEGVFPPAGWSYINGEPGAYWQQNDFYSYDGDFSVRAYQGYQSNYQANEWLITPQINFDDPAAQWLTFFGFTHSEPDGIREKLHVMAVDQVYDNAETLYDNAIILDAQPGWDYGEWEGEPNRTAVVSGPVVFGDVWGDQPVHTEDPDFLGSQVVLYPNPAYDYVHLHANDQEGMVYALYDMSGGRLRSAQLSSNNTRIPVYDLRPGIYLMKVLRGQTPVKNFLIIKK